ncbi:MAG: extracellular solute-binding protein [Oscillospiraceae bacterium]
MKRILALALTACLALTAFASCGAKAPSSVSAAPSSAPSDEKVKLVYWSMWNEAEPQGAVIKEATAAYMKANPNVTVEINWQGRELNKVIGTKLAAGEAIDIFDGPANTVLPAAIDHVADLTALFDKTYDTTNGKAYKDVVLNAVVETTKTYSKEGEINGVPYQPFVQCIFYNKDHFKAAGITELPKTWPEFLAVCEKLKAKGYAPLTCDDAYMPALPGYYLARAKGAEWVSKLTKENSDEMWKDPAVLEMAKAYADMAKKGYFHENITSNVVPAGQQDLANGTVSMYLNATWLVNELMSVTGPDFPWGQMHFPTVEGGEGKANSSNYASSVFAINKASANIEEAFKFTVYLTTGEWDGKMAEKTFGVPAGLDSVWPVQLADAKDVFVSIDEWIPWSGGLEDNGDLVATIRTAFTELIGGQLTPEKFVARMLEM